MTHTDARTSQSDQLTEAVQEIDVLEDSKFLNIFDSFLWDGCMYL